MISDRDILFVCLVESSDRDIIFVCLIEISTSVEDVHIWEKWGILGKNIYFPRFLFPLLSSNYSTKEKEICAIFYFVHKSLKLFGINDFDVIENF
jgi:hypothetical protein